MTRIFDDGLVCLQLITEQAALSLPRGAQIAGTCGSSEAELHVSWSNNAYTFRLYFSKVRKSDLPASVLHRVSNSVASLTLWTLSQGVDYKIIWICALRAAPTLCACVYTCVAMGMLVSLDLYYDNA